MRGSRSSRLVFVALLYAITAGLSTLFSPVPSAGASQLSVYELDAYRLPDGTLPIICVTQNGNPSLHHFCCDGRQCSSGPAALNHTFVEASYLVPNVPIRLHEPRVFVVFLVPEEQRLARAPPSFGA